VEDERRRTPRFPFTATAEVLEKGAPAAIAARVTELSLYGCYVEMSEPLAKGTEALLKVYSEGRYFESQANVVYSQPQVGIGVCFENVNPHYLTTLKQWLIEAAHAKFGKKG
jgi:PilZ domain